MRTIELGVTITDAALDDEITVVFCDLPVDGPDRCPGCGGTGKYRDTIVRQVTDLPVAGQPLQLRVQVPRYRCESTSCEWEAFRRNTDRLARTGASTTRRCARHALRRLMIDRTSIAAIARELGLSWDTVNAIATRATTGLLAADPARLESVRVIGVDEHRWAHTRRAPSDGYVAVIVDLTPVFDGTGPARLLDLVAGRSSAVLTTWLDERDADFRGRIEVVAMVPASGRYPQGSAATQALRPAGFEDAVTVKDPFHVVALAGTKLDLCRQRVQQHTSGHRGRSGDPLYGIRRTARTHEELLNDRQRRRLAKVFVDDRHIASRSPGGSTRTSSTPIPIPIVAVAGPS